MQATTQTTYAWSGYVHPKTGGSDYRLSGKMTLSGGTENEQNDRKIVSRKIRAILKKEGSAVLNDFVITKEEE